MKAVDPDQQVMGQTRDLGQWIERENEYAYGRLSGRFSPDSHCSHWRLPRSDCLALCLMVSRNGRMNSGYGWR